MTSARLTNLALPLLIFLALPLQALPSLREIPVPTFEFGTTAGIVTGTAHEYVYKNDEHLSELVWPMETIPTIGLQIAATWGGRLELSGSASFGLGRDCGTMTDSDFKNLPASDAKTHYSEHEATLDSMRDFSAALSWHFDLPARGPWAIKSMQLTPSLGIRSLTCDWTASNGYTQYGTEKSDGTYTEWNDGIAKTYLSGKVMTYTQEYLAPTVGVLFSIPFGNRFNAKIGANVSPYVWANGSDHHILRSTWFYDIMQGGYLVEPEADLSFNVMSRLSLFANARWTIIDGLRGDTYEQADSSDSYTKSAENGGAALNTLAVNIGLKVTTD